jgi:hypothetical protein
VSESGPVTIADFWTWLNSHVNCILRAGTPEAVLYDDEDLHWHLEVWESNYVVQLVRGKQLLGEIFIAGDRVDFVQEEETEDEGEHLFRLVGHEDGEAYPSCVFVLTHGFDQELEGKRRRVH